MKYMKQSALLIALTILFSGCKEEPVATLTNTPATAALPANIRLDAAPADAQQVAAARSAVKDGDRVVVQGVIGGRSDPIAANRAILTLLDQSIKTCDKTPDDGCTTPWDACCEPADVRAQNSLTIQVVNEENQPLRASLGTIQGVKPLALITVIGTAKVSKDGAMILNADGIHVTE